MNQTKEMKQTKLNTIICFNEYERYLKKATGKDKERLKIELEYFIKRCQKILNEV